MHDSDPRHWGPALWALLHLATASPSHYPGRLALLFRGLPAIIPCGRCRAHTADALAALDSRTLRASARGDGAFAFVVNLHNHANANARRPDWTLAEARRRWAGGGGAAAAAQGNGDAIRPPLSTGDCRAWGEALWAVVLNALPTHEPSRAGTLAELAAGIPALLPCGGCRAGALRFLRRTAPARLRAACGSVDRATAFFKELRGATEHRTTRPSNRPPGGP